MKGVRALRERDARDGGDSERAPADRPPAPAELAEQFSPLGPLQPLHRRNCHEDERHRAAGPDDRSEEMDGAQREIHDRSL